MYKLLAYFCSVKRSTFQWNNSTSYIVFIISFLSSWCYFNWHQIATPILNTLGNIQWTKYWKRCLVGFYLVISIIFSLIYSHSILLTIQLGIPVVLCHLLPNLGSCPWFFSFHLIRAFEWYFSSLHFRDVKQTQKS